MESYNELSIAHTRINVCSYNRSNQSDLPNVMSIPISLGTGLAITEYSFSRIYCVALLEVSTNFSPTFTERGEGSPFYIGVDELSPMFNRQSDGSNQKGLFKCAAIPDPDSSKITIRVLTHKVNYMKPISIPGRLTFRFYDEQKLPLRFEQDLYRFDVGSIFIDNPNQQIVFTLPPHDIRNGDRIILRGIQCTEDATLYDDSRRYRARVLSLTQVAIYAWRAAPYTITTTGGILICANNAVRVSLDIAHEM